MTKFLNGAIFPPVLGFLLVGAIGFIYNHYSCGRSEWADYEQRVLLAESLILETAKKGAPNAKTDFIIAMEQSGGGIFALPLAGMAVDMMITTLEANENNARKKVEKHKLECRRNHKTSLTPAQRDAALAIVSATFDKSMMSGERGQKQAQLVLGKKRDALRLLLERPEGEEIVLEKK